MRELVRSLGGLVTLWTMWLLPGAAAAQTTAPPAPPPYAPYGPTSAAPPVPPPRQTYSTKILGTELVNADDDTDIAVGRATITSADPRRRDVIESVPEERRKVEGKPITAAPLLGWGTAGMGLGVGARAGVTFETPVYVGGALVYHNGTTEQGSAPGLPDVHRRYVYGTVEGGYDVGIGPVLVRPYLGAGVLFRRAQVDATETTNTSSATDAAFLLYPGATVEYFFPGAPVFVGGDARVLLPFALEPASLTLFATAGVSL